MIHQEIKLIAFCLLIPSLIAFTPAKRCPGNLVYSDCGSACPKTCDNCNENIACTLQCVPGCTCPDGLVLLNENTCVPPSQCTSKRCPNNLVYSDCGSACEKTCENLNSPPRACPAVCIKGCFCPPGLVKYRNIICIPPQQCPRLDDCDRLGPQKNCLPPCQNYCYPYVGIYKSLCLNQCITNCVCRQGGWVRINGQCLTSKDCNGGNNNGCGPTEQYYNCIPDCPNTCELYGVRESIFCAYHCVPGCFCKPGLVKRSDGACVPYSQCPQAQNCPVNEFYDCIEPPGCMICDHPSRCPTFVCSPGCRCKDGFLRFQGVCIPQDNCI